LNNKLIVGGGVFVDLGKAYISVNRYIRFSEL
jgi:hypothetical protein